MDVADKDEVIRTSSLSQCSAELEPGHPRVEQTHSRKTDDRHVGTVVFNVDVDRGVNVASVDDLLAEVELALVLEIARVSRHEDADKQFEQGIEDGVHRLMTIETMFYKNSLFNAGSIWKRQLCVNENVSARYGSRAGTDRKSG